MYYGMNENMEVQLMVVGVDKNGKDIQSTTDSLEKNKENSIVAFSSIQRCPPYCSPPPPPPDEP
jgi:hypothetical protein